MGSGIPASYLAGDCDRSADLRLGCLLARSSFVCISDASHATAAIAGIRDIRAVYAYSASYRKEFPLEARTAAQRAIILLATITLIIVSITNILNGANMLNWSDEFEGPAGTPPDTASWTFVDNQPPGGGNQELEYYIPEGAALDGQGRLAITAKRDNGTYPAWYGPSQFTSG